MLFLLLNSHIRLSFTDTYIHTLYDNNLTRIFSMNHFQGYKSIFTLILINVIFSLFNYKLQICIYVCMCVAIICDMYL